MKNTGCNNVRTRDTCISARSAFSLIEILVTVALLSFIILGLLAMFHQTQRAFRGSITQTDVLEAGRALTDLLAREIEQMTPLNEPDVWDNGVRFRATNFFAEVPLAFFQPVLQDLPGSDNQRTNIIQRFFFVSRDNQDWTGIGYQVLPDYPQGAIGALYRHSASTRYFPGLLASNFLAAPLSNYNRIAEGIVHLRLRAFDTNGILLNPLWPTVTNYTVLTNVVTDWMSFNTAVPRVADQVNYYFVSNAVPAYLELELGILEPRIVQRVRGIGNTGAQRDYLSNHAAQVHLFRQRIPVRNVDPRAYQHEL